MLTAANAAGHRISTSGRTRRQRLLLITSTLCCTRSVLVGSLMMFCSWSRTPDWKTCIKSAAALRPSCERPARPDSSISWTGSSEAKPNAVWAAAARSSPVRVEAVTSLVQLLTELMTSRPLGACRRTRRLAVGAAEERVVRARRVAAAAVTFILAGWNEWIFATKSECIKEIN
jgi:hypothetical protein